MTKQKHALWFVMLNEVKHLARVSARLSQATQDRPQPHIGAVTKNHKRYSVRAGSRFRCFHHRLKVAIGFARPALISRSTRERARKFMRQKRAQQPEIVLEAQRVSRKCAPEGLTCEDTVAVIEGFEPDIPEDTAVRSLPRRHQGIRLDSIALANEPAEYFLRFGAAPSGLKRGRKKRKAPEAQRLGQINKRAMLAHAQAEPHVVVMAARTKFLAKAANRIQRLTPHDDSGRHNR